jgi:membrane protein
VQALTVFKDPRALFSLLKDTYSDWSEDKASRLAAALAYYTAFSIAPLLLITIAVAGLVFGREAAQGRIVGQLEGVMGPAAGAIETSLANSQDTSAGTLSAIIGLATLVWSASSLFGQLQESLNTIWEVAPDPNAGLVATLRRRFLSMTMVLGVGFVLLVSLVVTAGVSAVGTFFGDLLPGGAFLWQIVNFLLSFAVIMLLFAAIYKVLPDVTVDWSDVWIGSAVTALLFTVGKLLIGLYLGHASIGSTFGAAGSLLVFLVWVEYSAQILFFGAEFTQVYARRYGSRIVPAEGAVALDEESRAQQGMPARETVERAAAVQSGHGLATPLPHQPHATRRSTGNPLDANRAGVMESGSRTETNTNSHAVSNATGSGHKRRPRGSGGTKGAPNGGQETAVGGCGIWLDGARDTCSTPREC